MADVKVEGYAAQDSSGHLAPFLFTRRATGPKDVTFKISYCGICHSDLHQIRDEWGGSIFPMVPGHELVGVVTEVGAEVTRFKVGDHVGVGCMVSSCGKCDAYEKKVEQYCSRTVWTYNSLDAQGKPTNGGYSTLMVADEKFVLRIPDSLPLDGAAPLLCAGVTVYSPMCYFGMTEKGKHFGVVGLGGLGHMAVKFGKAFGMEVTVISTSPRKKTEAIDILGADHFLVSTDKDAMKKATKSLDYIIDTVSAVHALEPLLDLLTVNGKLVLVGIPEKPLQMQPKAVIFGRRFVGGSLIGGVEETQKMLDFCAEKRITSTIEKIPMHYVNTAMERLAKSDVKYRFVIDLETFHNST
ncbi:hypothetical protein GOP47_0030482 [Adiantum capillus-veneris]|nr:hypothetical protein GOP47_0030209 [Adiantum capillus-veneris]KAI5055337.1 hypothetical protein GOP47_0030482 [Adiantum capillus-veneris]